jgi:hypothetical protein
MMARWRSAPWQPIPRLRPPETSARGVSETLALARGFGDFVAVGAGEVFGPWLDFVVLASVFAALVAIAARLYGRKGT